MCSTQRPYVSQRNDVPTIDGDEANVCGLSETTCEGLRAFRSPPDCASDDACGLSNQPDGYCRPFPAGGNRCTIPCGSSDDCRVNYACNTTLGQPVCSLQDGSCYIDADCPSGALGACNQGTKTCN